MQIPAHIERSLIGLSSQMQSCFERLDSLEERMEELADAVVNTPSHGDVLEVRMHSAKLAAELARATVELRGEIGMASEEARRAARVRRTSDTGEIPLIMPVDLEGAEASRIQIDLRGPEAKRPEIEGFGPTSDGGGNGSGNGNGDGGGGSNGNGNGNGNGKKNHGDDGDWSASA